MLKSSTVVRLDVALIGGLIIIEIRTLIGRHLRRVEIGGIFQVVAAIPRAGVVQILVVLGIGIAQILVVLSVRIVQALTVLSIVVQILPSGIVQTLLTVVLTTTGALGKVLTHARIGIEIVVTILHAASIVQVVAILKAVLVAVAVLEVILLIAAVGQVVAVFHAVRETLALIALLLLAILQVIVVLVVLQL